MPIYEYACEKCDHEFEREQRITEEPIKICPSCRAPRARRLISRTSFLLKGGGWYSDLYSSRQASRTDGKEAGKDAAKETSSDKKSDATEKSPGKDTASKSSKSDPGPKAAA